jgi:transcriptional regulator with XRE-family HTH domain
VKRFDDLNHKTGPGSDDRVAAHRRAMERELTLAEVRKARELTQKQLAAALDMTQPGVSAIEQRTDLFVSTLRSYVEALGGRLEIAAVFPDGVLPITNFAELADDELERDLATA